jgi:HK97 gp10 family phage protein
MKLISRIGSYTRRVERELERVVLLTMLAIEARAKIAAPVRTGNLRDSITSQQISSLSAIVGATADYAPYVEFGTRYMQARPFLFPAFEAEKRDFQRQIARILKQR